MKERTDKRIIRSKSAIKKAFLNLLYRKPFEQITISEIVGEANYNRGTFYSNFETKDCLLYEVIDDVLNEMINQIRKPYQTTERVDMEQLKISDVTLFKYFKENMSLYKLLLSDHIRVDFRFKMAKAIEKMFIEEYKYELGDESIDIKWLYTYRAYGLTGLIIRWIEEDCPDTPEYMTDQTLKLMTTATMVFHVKKNI